MIISVSRRTDIPAFYSDWFMNRVEQGHVISVNPFNAKQTKTVSLAPEDVDVFVFWTRNAGPLLKHIDRLLDLGFNLYFHYTIVNYPAQLEPHAPQINKTIDSLKKLSDRIGREKIVWRYDPIFFSNLTPVTWHMDNFDFLADKVCDHTNGIVISFIDFYRKTLANLKSIDDLSYTTTLECLDKINLLCEHIAKQHIDKGLIVKTCSESMDLSRYGIKKGACIDIAELNRTFGLHLPERNHSKLRGECLCYESIDIGMYDTCLHGCKYCYATQNHMVAKNNHKKHTSTGSTLIRMSK